MDKKELNEKVLAEVAGGVTPEEMLEEMVATRFPPHAASTDRPKLEPTVEKWEMAADPAEESREAARTDAFNHVPNSMPEISNGIGDIASILLDRS